ncbi:MAG: YraN family protein [Acidimicrobiia bacterium]
MAPDARRQLGDAGEALVARWYEARGFVVVDRNWRCREGELDLVCAGPAGEGSVLVFCEVKTRRSTAFGSPLEAVTITKQRRIRVLARKWLDEQGSAGGRRAPRLRFDVAAVLALPGTAPQVHVVEGAF